MTNIFDYLEWRGDLDFERSPFNEADSLILTRLAYIPFDGTVSSEFSRRVPLPAAADAFLAKPDAEKLVRMPLDLRLLRATAASERFKGVLVSGYVNEYDLAAEKQFSALCFTLPSLTYLAFRGTDGTIVGWKEDFNMSFTCPVPAQKDAAEHLRRLLREVGGDIAVGGHSKGGNLAVYAASQSGRDSGRIKAVYNNDGPGFTEQTLAQPGFAEIGDRVHTFVPQSSIVGMLLEHCEDYTVVNSDNIGIMQHDLYSWEVIGPGFRKLERITPSSRAVDETLQKWISGMSLEQREAFTDRLFGALTSTGASTLRDLAEHPYRTSTALLRAFSDDSDSDMTSEIGKVISALIKSAGSDAVKAVKREKQS